MDRVIKLIPLILFPIHIYSQEPFSLPEDYPEIPEKCEMTKHVGHQCCLFPPFFDRDAAKNCGGRFSVMFTDLANASGFRRSIDGGCSYWRCLLKRYDIVSLTDEKKLDDVRYYDHLTAWVELNPEFSNVMVRAKLECKHTFKSTMPIRVCNFFQFNSCIRNFITVNCPKVINTPECIEMKKFYEACREYYQ